MSNKVYFNIAKRVILASGKEVFIMLPCVCEISKTKPFTISGDGKTDWAKQAAAGNKIFLDTRKKLLKGDFENHLLEDFVVFGKKAQNHEANAEENEYLAALL